MRPASQMYWQEIRTGMGLDVERFLELARRLALSGREGYVLHSESERRHLDSASQRMKRIAKVRCCELDGLVVERHPASTWEHIEEALGNRFAYKPAGVFQVGGGGAVRYPVCAATEGRQWFGWPGHSRRDCSSLVCC